MSATSDPYSPKYTDRVTLAVKKNKLEVEEIIVNKTLIEVQFKSQILHNIGVISIRESFRKLISSDTLIGSTLSPTDYAMAS